MPNPGIKRRRASVLQVRQTPPPKIQIMDQSQFIQIQPQTQLTTNYGQKQPVLYYQTILIPPPPTNSQQGLL